MEQEAWLATNRAAIMGRLHRLKGKPEGVIFAKRSELHVLAVVKVGSQIQLIFVDPTAREVQSRLDLDDPLYLVSPYTQAAMLGLLWKNNPRRVYVAGFGGGRIPMVLHHYFPDLVIECTEIDPEVIEVASMFFGIQLDSRMSVAVQDARDYLAQRGEHIQYDIILVDAFHGNGYGPYRLATRDFYELCKSRLSPEGGVVVNMLHNDSLYIEKIKTIQSAFEQIYLSSLLEWGTSVVIGTSSAFVDIHLLVERARSVQGFHQFSFPFVERASELRTYPEITGEVPGIDEARVLTDASPPPGYFESLSPLSLFFAP